MNGNGHVLLPVAVVSVTVGGRVFELRRNGSDPDGCEAHVLDVVQLFPPLAVLLFHLERLSGRTFLMIPCHVPPQYFLASVSQGASVEPSGRANRSVSRK